MLLVAAAVPVAFLYSPALPRMRLKLALHRARTAVESHAAPRFSIANEVVAGTIADALPAEKRRIVLASTLADVAKDVDGDHRARARAAAQILTADFGLAAETLETIPVERRDATTWNDIAAANLAAAGSKDHERILLAIDAANQALQHDPRLPHALFNRALAEETLGLVQLARRTWHRYLLYDASSKWASIAEQRRALYSATDRSAWKSAMPAMPAMSPADIGVLALRFPQQARTHAEGAFTAAWAAAILASDLQEAERNLAQARILAAAIRRQSGESLAADAVDAIDHAGPERLQHLVAGHLAYKNGRMAYGRGQLSVAERELTAAVRSFRAGGSPMVAAAELALTSVLISQNKLDAAEDRLATLLAEQRTKTPSHKALIAHILWNVSLCEAQRGRWSASLAAASEASRIFRCLGEPGHAAATEAILSETYDLLGQRSLAWQYGPEALRGSAVDGSDPTRVRAALAALCRTELRTDRWRNAHTLITLEQRLATRAEPLLDADMFLRAATAHFRTGDHDGATRDLARARTSALALPDHHERAKLVADVDAVAGSILRRTNPRQGAERLTAAIAFQRGAGRSLVLPQLLLERGRAHRAAGAAGSAQRDYDDGIAELERQRSHVVSAELRPGLFDKAFELFEEAIDLQLERNAAPDVVFGYVERGRARAMFEEMSADAPRFHPRHTLTAIQQDLGEGDRLVEYFVLRDRLAVFVIAPRSLELHVAPVPRRVLEHRIGQFAAALSARSDPDAARRAGAALYDVLLAPVARHLDSATSITVVPDPLMQHMPFTALFDRTTRSFVITRFEVSTVPSAAVFATNNRRLATMVSGAPHSAAIFTNPDLSQSAYTGLAPLAGAASEASKIARHYTTVTAFTGGEATVERFLETAPMRQVVHFGGHAAPDRDDETHPVLLFTPSPSDPGALTHRTIARHDFTSTRLVVLAACGTMTGPEAAMEGVPSLARAFLVAGVPAVIGTLWNIDDRSAAPLVSRIHAHVARGTSPAAALRAAQIEAIQSRDRNTSHPRHWAAFSLMGK